MIAILISMYIFLKYVLDMNQEEVYKFMLAISFVNLIPLIIYTVYSVFYGDFNLGLLVIMTVV
jgi:hypothetical protein